MQKSTKSSGRTAAIVAALGTTVVVLLFFGSVLWAMLEEGPIPAVVGIMIVYAVLAVAIVVGVLRAMVQRLREIKGGEKVLRPVRPGANGTRCGEFYSLPYCRSLPLWPVPPCALFPVCPSGAYCCVWCWPSCAWP